MPKEDLKFQRSLRFFTSGRLQLRPSITERGVGLSDKKNSDVALLYAETYILPGKTEPAADILAQIPIRDRDSRWHGITGADQTFN